MGLNTAGLTALLEDGTATVMYAAIGDGPLAADQVSTGRTLLSLAAQDGELTASGSLAFTGTPDGVASHVLLFSAATAGTFLGSTVIGGDHAFNAAGDFTVSGLTFAVNRPDAAPLAPFTVGTQVGVPAGTTLTASSGTATNDGTEEITLRHPISGQEEALTVTVFRGRRWSDTLTVNPGPGQTYLFENCEFVNALDNWCVEVAEDNGRSDQMAPLAVFRHCTFDGQDTTGRALLGPYSWVENCHLANASDGWQGGIYSVGIASNILGDTDGSEEAHSDGFQIVGVGHTTLHGCFISAGSETGASSAVRVGTEFSAVTGVEIHYCGIDRGGFMMQFGGQESRHITDVSVVGCRWTDTAGFGPTDFVLVDAPVEWIDNAFADGTPIENPVS